MYYYIFIYFYLDLPAGDIGSISIALKAFYRDKFSKTRTSPLDDKSIKKLEEIYVNLSLLTGKRKDQREDIAYESVIGGLTNTENIVRIAFVGEAGVGKTTLLQKMAYDWAHCRHLRDVALLLFVPLREMENGSSLRDILQMYVSHGIGLDYKKVEDFIRSDPKKVMFLLDGLDEYNGQLRDPEPTSTLVSIMRGDKMKHSPVVITTRPWRAEQITSTPKLELRYSLITVNGFKKEDVKEYITRYFHDDTKSGKSLITLVTEDSLVAKYMAPYPIFCCMLCNMWKDESVRAKVSSLETFSQFFEEMVWSLIEHWLSKSTFREYRKHFNDSLKQLGNVAFDGILNNTLVFTEEAFDGCMDAMKTGCKVGILSSESRFARVGKGNKEFIDVSFPHKLFQEHLAGKYLASLYHVDQEFFWKLVKENIVPEYQNFRYLLYFTAAHGKEPGQAGKPLLEYMCSEIADEEFIVDVAFECHEESALSPVITYFHEHCTQLQLSQRLQILEKHTWIGYMNIFAICGVKWVRNIDSFHYDYIDIFHHKSAILVLVHLTERGFFMHITLNLSCIDN